MELETITITIKKVGDKHQFAVNEMQSPLSYDSASMAIKAVWLTFASAENITNSGPEGERMDGVGIAMLIKAILSVCVENVKEQIQGAAPDQRLAAGSRLKTLFAEQRIPSDDLVKLVLTTLLEARLVRPQPADKKIEDEIQDLCRTRTAP